MKLEGSFVAIVTPFSPDGSVNYQKLGQLIDWHAEQGTDGIVVLGTTGETPTLSHEECHELCRFAVEKAAKRIPIIAGSGSNSTQTMLEKSLEYQALGADGLLVISPYYNKANAEGMYRHFATVADAVSIPCILYNVPGRTSCAIPEGVVARLARHPNIAGIKEASGDIGYAARIARYLSDDFVMLSGNDDMIVPIMSLGGKGVISVYANAMPKESHEITAAYLEGNHKRALELQLKYLPFINSLFYEVNPIPVKAAMNLMGMDVGGYRLPLCEMGEDAHARMKAVMKESGII